MKRWTEEELELSISLLKNGKDYTYIGDVLNRTAKSIKVKLQKEGECITDYINCENVINCLNCGNDIVISENNTQQKNRKFCSKSCSATYNNKLRETDVYNKISSSLKTFNEKPHKVEYKKCLCCDNKVKRNVHIFCSTNCQHNYEYNNYINDWKKGINSGTIKGGELSRHVRKYISDKYDNKCAECGWDKINKHTGKKPLEIDHIDGDSSNNIEENLILICPNCHSLTPTYKGANKGKGRTQRMKNYYKNKM